MSLNWEMLLSNGRCKALGVPWSPEELEALLTLERECALTRKEAADYIRNGVTSPEHFNQAQKKDFKPKTLDEAVVEMTDGLKARGEALLGSKGKRKTK